MTKYFFLLLFSCVLLSSEQIFASTNERTEGPKNSQLVLSSVKHPQRAVSTLSVEYGDETLRIQHGDKKFKDEQDFYDQLPRLINDPNLKELKIVRFVNAESSLMSKVMVNLLATNLVFLSLIGERLGLNQLKIIGKLISLTSLNLSVTDFQNKYLQDSDLVCLNKLSKLKELTLNGQSDITEGVFYNLYGLTSLEVFDLQYCGPDNSINRYGLTDEGYGYISKLTNLREIYIGDSEKNILEDPRTKILVQHGVTLMKIREHLGSLECEVGFSPSKTFVILDANSIIKCKDNLLVPSINYLVHWGYPFVISSAWKNFNKTLDLLRNKGLEDALKFNDIKEGTDKWPMTLDQHYETIKYRTSGLVTSVKKPERRQVYKLLKVLSFRYSYPDLDPDLIQNIIFVDISKTGVNNFPRHMRMCNLFKNAKNIDVFRLNK